MGGGAPHPNAAMIARFYDALARRDAATMIACYAPDATFSDPVFQALDAAGVAAMWQMLCARGKDLQVVASDIEADAETGRAHWVATYTFSATGRRVENRIDARFTFRDGRIVRHEDRFDLRRWLRQALGFKGALLGWLPPVQRATRVQAAKALADWRARHGASAGALEQRALP
jgi:ketosteroid isomerase-like protein